MEKETPSFVTMRAKDKLQPLAGPGMEFDEWHELIIQNKFMYYRVLEGEDGVGLGLESMDIAHRR